MEQVYKEKMEVQGERMGILNEQINSYKAQVSTLENNTKTNWTIVIIAVIVGLVIGWLISRH